MSSYSEVCRNSRDRQRALTAARSARLAVELEVTLVEAACEASDLSAQNASAGWLAPTHRRLSSGIPTVAVRRSMALSQLKVPASDATHWLSALKEPGLAGSRDLTFARKILR